MLPNSGQWLDVGCGLPSAVTSLTYTRPGIPAWTLFFSKISLILRRNSRLTAYCRFGLVLTRTRYSASPLATRSMPGTCTSARMSLQAGDDIGHDPACEQDILHVSEDVLFARRIMTDVVAGLFQQSDDFVGWFAVGHRNMECNLRPVTSHVGNDL